MGEILEDLQEFADSRGALGGALVDKLIGGGLITEDDLYEVCDDNGGDEDEPSAEQNENLKEDIINRIDGNCADSDGSFTDEELNILGEITKDFINSDRERIMAIGEDMSGYGYINRDDYIAEDE